ncbi:hypothetical protein H6G89_04285 [Oscillatoria sp. FACHB-1407]|nr:hypothetical protein [Oscillatoria sp. FACHB-1407]MBD2460255.1 hypothetical protein [Oscillatoria sp. FACHB-1407]
MARIFKDVEGIVGTRRVCLQRDCSEEDTLSHLSRQLLQQRSIFFRQN